MVVRLLLPLMGLMCVSAGVLPRDRAPRATVERHVVAMGTSLRLTVTGADRTAALCASEAAVRAVEATEQRLSTWRADSELARFAAAPRTDRTGAAPIGRAACPGGSAPRRPTWVRCR